MTRDEEIFKAHQIGMTFAEIGHHFNISTLHAERCCKRAEESLMKKASPEWRQRHEDASQRLREARQEMDRLKAELVAQLVPD